MAIIYKLENLQTGKVYIGQSIQHAKKRAQDHFLKLRKGKHWNKHLQNSWNKYTEKSFKFFVILCGNFEVDELNILEQRYIDLYDSYNQGYNQTLGGFSCKRSKVSKLKMSKSKKELYKRQKHPWLGRKHSYKSKQKMSEARLGKAPWNKGKPKEQQANYDHVVYKWKHTKLDLEEECTPAVLTDKYNLNRSHVSKLIKGTRHIHKGWCFNGKVTNNL